MILAGVLACFVLPSVSSLTKQGPEVKISASRSEIVLNGIWAFYPGGEEIASKRESGQIWVPGDWRKSSGDAPTVVAEGSGERWKLDRDTLGQAWYERDILVPETWKGRRVLISLDRVSTDATVYLDGQLMGEVRWPSGQVDLTKHVKPGLKQTLRLKVVATADANQVAVLMGVGQVSTREAQLAWRGVMDDIVLQSEPVSGRIDDVFIKTSVRKKEFSVEAQLQNVPRGGVFEVFADIRDEQGKSARKFRQFVTLAPGKSVPFQVRWRWLDPRLWDLDQPNLYYLHLTVRSQDSTDTLVERFGFREFWVEGRQFKLNGTTFRFRPTLGYDGGVEARSLDMIRESRKRGFNSQEIWPNNDQARGYPQWWKHHVEIADRLGWPLMGPSVHMDPVVSWWQPEKWSNPVDRQAWLSVFRRELKRYRNHPSILMWANSGNNFGHNDDQSPRRIGQSRKRPGLWDNENERWTKHHDRGDDVFRTLRSLDPTRPFMAHQGGPVSDVYTANTYLNFLPLQDREEWLSEWAKSGDMPFCAVEFGTPLNCSFLRGRNGFGGAISSEPLVTEYAAMFLGSAAYSGESRDYRTAIKNSFVQNQEYRWWMFEPSHQFGTPFQSTQELFIKNTWRSWRTWGISGGMVPWSGAHGYQANHASPVLRQPAFQPGHRGLYQSTVPGGALLRSQIVHAAGRALQSVNRDTLAYIGGDVTAFTEKQHNYVKNSRIRKSVILINDSRRPVKFSYHWKSLSEQRSGRGILKVGEIRKIPVQIMAASIGRHQIRLTATVGSESFRDQFEFRVFAPLPGKYPSIQLWDPKNESTAMFRKAGVKQGGAKDLFVVGRNALASGNALPLKLEKFVADGGRVLIMAQNPEWWKVNGGFRISAYASRAAFPVSTTSALTRGLTANDLKDWAGSSTLVNSKPLEATLPRPNHDTTPWYGWRWGLNGVIATTMLEKPHRSGWTPLLEGEFDLAYSPLMTLRYGKGRISICTIDFEDQAFRDPVATLLLSRVLIEANRPGITTMKQSVPLFGSKTTLVKSVGLSTFTEAWPPRNNVSLISEDSDVTWAEIEPYVVSGGTAIILPRKKSLGPFIVGKQYALAPSTQSPTDPILSGISTSELRMRSVTETFIVRGAHAVAGGRIAIFRKGKGVAVLFQMDPDNLNADEWTYNRLTRWRQTRAFAQILANAGIQLAQDARIFKFTPDGSGHLNLSGPWQAVVTNRFSTTAESPIIPDPDSNVLGFLTGQRQEGWQSVRVPSMWEPLQPAGTEAVYRTQFDLPANWQGKEIVLNLGAVDDFDDTFVNGHRVGATRSTTTSWWSHSRTYEIPASILRPGKNLLSVRVVNTNGDGGLAGPQYRMKIRLKDFRSAWSYYHEDYRDDWDLGDDPYRYYRW